MRTIGSAGADLDQEGLRETPGRVADAYVELFARDLQLQERLTTQIADWVHEHGAKTLDVGASRGCARRLAHSGEVP